MAGMKFSPLAESLGQDKAFSCESPLALPGGGRVMFRKVSENDGGVVTLDVTLLGVHMGQLVGKPSAGTSWRFTNGSSTS